MSKNLSLKGKGDEPEVEGNSVYNNAERHTRRTTRQRERERTPTVEWRGDSLDTAELVSGVSLLI